ncbi:hypothetical protein EDD85DRAFT_796048 [Armillaria nabsnona]|nr:hypothetical protein EDD85DRAFT_796048 [Armillaria nabsnona]
MVDIDEMQGPSLPAMIRLGKIWFVQDHDAFFLKAISTSFAWSFFDEAINVSPSPEAHAIMDGVVAPTEPRIIRPASPNVVPRPPALFLLRLGRTNNYIEFVGETMHVDEHIGVSYRTRRMARRERGNCFLRPGKWIPWVVLAVIVLVLHLNEKREDELERRKASRRTNLDTL